MATPEFDREILRNFAQNMFPREGYDESQYAYCAEYIGANGTYVWQAKVLGWEVVRGDMPENRSHRDAAGNCVIGDVVVMRMPRERYESLQEARQALVREQRGDKTAEQLRAEIDDKVSRLVGHNINVSFQFKDRRELAQRKGE